jgi:hypothetical protein
MDLRKTLEERYKNLPGPVHELIETTLADPATYRQLKCETLDAVVANRRAQLAKFLEDPSVLFCGADLPVANICRATVQAGTAQPLLPLTSGERADLAGRLAKGTFAPEAEVKWKATLGDQYRLMRIEVADLGFVCAGTKVETVEILLQRLPGHKAVQDARILCADKTSRRETGRASAAAGSGPGFAATAMSLRSTFPGDKVEYDTMNMPLALAGDAHWQAKETDWRLGTGGNRRKYYGEVHPKICQYAVDLLSSEDSLTILDVAGGNGDLAERLIRELTAAHMFGELKINYFLLDYSDTDVEVANRRFATLKRICPHANAIAVVRNMFKYNFDAAALRHDLHLPVAGVDLVINSGGLLNTQIGDDRDVPAKFSGMYCALMAPGGYGIYSGLTPLLVNAATHRAQGLRILNLHDCEFDLQLHVVRRPN